jgi:hypothetical protein
MFTSEDFSLLTWGLLLGSACIYNLRRNGYAHEIYLIWYINSFFFVLFYGMGIIAGQNNVGLMEVCGATYQSSCQSIYNYLTNVEDEVRLIAAVTALALGPQFLTYILSGLFGCASPPRFVSQTAKVAIWSFVKFAAGLGGILTAQPLANLTFGKPFVVHELLVGFRYTVLAFVYASFYVSMSEALPTYFYREFGGLLPRAMSKIHQFFTRNVSAPASPPPKAP